MQDVFASVHPVPLMSQQTQQSKANTGCNEFHTGTTVPAGITRNVSGRGGFKMLWVSEKCMILHSS